jgi:sRNA-binding regulator protein Hfq
VAKRDKFHQAVINGLQADGWIITHDPYIVEYGEQNLQVDLGAEMPIGAEKEGRKIAVEIKTFAGISTMHDLYAAIGQYLVYQHLILKIEPERKLYLAVPDDVYDKIFYPRHADEMRTGFGIHLALYDPDLEEIIAWIE